MSNRDFIAGLALGAVSAIIVSGAFASIAPSPPEPEPPEQSAPAVQSITEYHLPPLSHECTPAQHVRLLADGSGIAVKVCMVHYPASYFEAGPQ